MATGRKGGTWEGSEMEGDAMQEGVAICSVGGVRDGDTRLQLFYADEHSLH